MPGAQLLAKCKDRAIRCNVFFIRADNNMEEKNDRRAIMNLIAIIGNASTAPEVEYTATGKAIATFRVAVSRPGGDSADFFTVVTHERQAEVVSEYVTAGRRLGIEGRLHHSTWTDDSGEGRSKVEIVASRVQLLGKMAGEVAES